MLGFREVHGKGRVRGFIRKTHRWDEVTFLIGFSTRKTNPEGRAESLRDRTGLRIPPLAEKAGILSPLA